MKTDSIKISECYIEDTATDLRQGRGMKEHGEQDLYTIKKVDNVLSQMCNLNKVLS